MVETLGILLALLLAGLAWLMWRLARLLRGLLPARAPIRAAPLRLARRRLRRADDRAAELTREIHRLRLALRAAQAAPAPGGQDRFQKAKRAFALRFHPDRLTAPPPERRIRVAMFQEHWGELRRIERE